MAEISASNLLTQFAQQIRPTKRKSYKRFPRSLKNTVAVRHFPNLPVLLMSDRYGRPLHPPEECETIFIEKRLVSSAHGIFIPQIFVAQTKKLDRVPSWAWKNCREGPSALSGQDDYFDSWSEILDTYEYTSTGVGGSVERYFLDYDEGDLCLMREIVEPPNYKDQ
jgi:hypothetical protein